MPDDLDLPQGTNLFPESLIVIGNRTLVCHDPQKISSYGLWTRVNPLNFSTPLLLMQLSLVSLTSMLIDFLIKPLGQCTMISQIFGGIIYGPSLLGHEALVGAVLFPPRGRIIFETFATFGIMFFFFTVGVKMDPKLMIRPGRKPMILGLSALFTTLGFSLMLSFGLKEFGHLNPDLAASLPIIASSQCILSFQNVASVLSELKMLQSDLGRIAILSAMFCDLIFLMATGCAILQSSRDNLAVSMSALSVFGVFILVLVFIFRPLILRSVRRMPEGKPVSESQVSGIFIVLLLVSFVSEMIGQHFVIGPMIFGLVVPEGPPLGSAITSKLDIPVGKILYPSFLTASGLKTDIFTIHFEYFWTVGLIVVLSCIVKMLAVMLPALYMKMPFRDSLVLGLMLNSKGISDLVYFNLLFDTQALDSEAFAICIVFVIIVTSIVTPLIKLLYNPSRRNIPVRRRNIQHSKLDAEMRILVCIHNHENVPEILNLLEVSNATEQSPISAIAVLLVELVGRANPMLIAHQPHRMLQPNSSRSSRIVNALHQYELNHDACVSFTSFSSFAHFDSMHEDICRVALDHNAMIIILPFHKRWEIDGSIGSVNRGIQSMNSKVIENAPCSIAILVDRGLLRGTTSILNCSSQYQLGLIFIGGADDAEALFYASRMVRRPNVTLTIYRYLLFGSDNTRERKLDNHLMDEIRQANMGNKRFVYQEEIIRDCVGLAASIRGLGSNKFDLILVGRSHPDYSLLVGFGAWIDCPELGIIGDILAEADSGRASSVLVVQQQRLMKFNQKSSTSPQVVPFSLHDS